MTASSGTLIDYPHFSKLANSGLAPYRGAYCLRVQLNGGVTDQYCREDTLFDDWTAGPTDRWLRFYFYLSKDFNMADADLFSMFEAESTLNTTTRVACGILRNGANLYYWANNLRGSVVPATDGINMGTLAAGTNCALGKWWCAEVAGHLAGGAAGTIDFYLNGTAGTQVAGLTQTAIVDAKIGVLGPMAGTSGTVLIDDFIYDDTGRIYPDATRYRILNVVQRQASDHIVLGPGRLSCAVQGTGAAGNATLYLYDTDAVPGTTNTPTPFLFMTNTVAQEFIPGHDIFEFEKGCYSVMGGTAAQAYFSISRGGLVSDASVIAYGLRTGRPRP